MRYIEAEREKFVNHDFSPEVAHKEAILTFVLWFVSALFYVVAVKRISSFRSVYYFEEAISQGIGPVLWNVIGVLGMSMFSLAVMMPNVKAFSVAAKHVLENVFVVGALTLGLLTGQLVNLAPGLEANFEEWKLFLLVPIIIVILGLGIFFDFMIWYFSQLVSWQGAFMLKLQKVSWMLRVPCGLAVILAGLLFLWLEA